MKLPFVATSVALLIFSNRIFGGVTASHTNHNGVDGDSGQPPLPRSPHGHLRGEQHLPVGIRNLQGPEYEYEQDPKRRRLKA